jgi:hypothetical protein
MSKRRNRDAAFKVREALEAVKGKRTVSEAARRPLRSTRIRCGRFMRRLGSWLWPTILYHECRPWRSTARRSLLQRNLNRSAEAGSSSHSRLGYMHGTECGQQRSQRCDGWRSKLPFSPKF